MGAGLNGIARIVVTVLRGSGGVSYAQAGVADISSGNACGCHIWGTLGRNGKSSPKYTLSICPFCRVADATGTVRGVRKAPIFISCSCFTCTVSLREKGEVAVWQFAAIPQTNAAVFAGLQKGKPIVCVRCIIRCFSTPVLSGSDDEGIFSACDMQAPRYEWNDDRVLQCDFSATDASAMFITALFMIA